MGLGPFSSDSKSSQESVNVGGSGQYIKKGTVAQGGSVQVGKGANVGGTTLTGAKGPVTINNTGLGKADFESLIGSLAAATPAQVQQATPAAVTPPVTNQAGDSKSKYFTVGLAVMAAIAAGLLARKIFR